MGARFTLYPDVGLIETLCGRRFLAFRWRDAVREAVRLGRSLWFRRLGASLAPSSGRNTGGLHGSTLQDWPSLGLSGAACARRKALRGRCPALTRKPALSKTPLFSVATQKKTLRDPARKWPFMDTKAKGLLYTSGGGFTCADAPPARLGEK